VVNEGKPKGDQDERPMYLSLSYSCLLDSVYKFDYRLHSCIALAGLLAYLYTLTSLS
jgi:hypothetical protein